MRQTEIVLEALAGSGLLLKQDKTLPNVVGLVVGKSLTTSWWGHPNADVVFAVLSELSDHEQVLFTKLVARKDTLVHRSLWPALATIGQAHDAWQTESITSAARDLLVRLEHEHEVQATGPAVKDLEFRLLVAAREVHSTSGRHEVLLESWNHFCKRTRTRVLGSSAQAQQRLEEAVAKLGGSRKQLPWGQS